MSPPKLNDVFTLHDEITSRLEYSWEDNGVLPNHPRIEPELLSTEVCFDLSLIPFEEYEHLALNGETIRTVVSHDDIATDFEVTLEVTLSRLRGNIACFTLEQKGLTRL